jgi:hypothetical protein
MTRKSKPEPQNEDVQRVLQTVVQSISGIDQLEQGIVDHFIQVLNVDEEQGGLSNFEKIKILEILKKEKAKNIGSFLGLLKQAAEQNPNINMFFMSPPASTGNSAEERDVTPEMDARDQINFVKARNVLEFLQKADKVKLPEPEKDVTPDAPV